MTTREPGREPLDEQSLRLLDRLQAHIPLVERPFLSLGQELGISEESVVQRLADLKERGLVRQTSAIFEASALGYRSCLVAARYDPASLDASAAVISAYPGVSHNYERCHDFNLWYTLAVPPGESLPDTVAVLGRLSGATSSLALPTVRRFKLGVRLSLGAPQASRPAEDDDTDAPAAECAPLTLAEIRAVRALQDDLPVTALPFEEPAAREGFRSAADLLEVAAGLHARGVLRRFSSVLRHRVAGFKANGMVVWDVGQDSVEQAGRTLAAFPEVSHCYERPVYDEWPFALYTMVHGRSTDEVEECVARMASATGLARHQVLYSRTEYKKRRVRYFTNEWAAWRDCREGSVIS